MICSCCRNVVERLIRKRWCRNCYLKGRRDGSISTIRDKTAERKLTDWVEDFIIIYNRPFMVTKAQVAQAMGGKRDTFDRTLVRARKAGLLPDKYSFPKEKI